MSNRFLDLISNNLESDARINYYENINIYTNNRNLQPRSPRRNSNLNRGRRRRTSNIISMPGNHTPSNNTSIPSNHVTSNNISIPSNPTPSNNTLYTETIESEPIITSFTISPSDISNNHLLNTLSNIIGNRQEGINIENINSNTNLITINNNNSETYIGEKCSICNVEYQEGQILRKLNNCNHVFHYECVDTWFSRHSTCPICRDDLNEINLSS